MADLGSARRAHVGGALEAFLIVVALIAGSVAFAAGALLVVAAVASLVLPESLPSRAGGPLIALPTFLLAAPPTLLIWRRGLRRLQTLAHPPAQSKEDPRP